VTASPSPATQFTSGLTFATSQELLERGVTTTSFNFAYLRTLFIRVGVNNAPKLSVMKLTLTNPRGELVYESAPPYSGDPNMTAMASPHNPNVGHPIAVLQAKPFGTGFALDNVIPVAGSVVSRYPEDGPWHVVATIDDQLYSADLQVTFQP
jgi:hypothetical protein